MDPKTDKLIRRTTIGVTVVAAYLLLTADYGPNPNVLDPIKKAIQSAELSVKRVLFNSGKEETVENGKEKQSSLDSKDHP
ncbi:hypothetical protein CKAN_02093600 [Cinnamomum micranthum f. kanehirae]|uniref:Uncharacterized protein n=1 Tax=Cinnamomum micranthum f. kanehirae TaxID=337451 RepID=A0A443PLW4_9MAGN|nr:hypothetical protein CKAN_02093600 [Cinnamomum micranthum f. kanehirae]